MDKRILHELLIALGCETQKNTMLKPIKREGINVFDKIHQICPFDN